MKENRTEKKCTPILPFTIFTCGIAYKSVEYSITVFNFLDALVATVVIIIVSIFSSIFWPFVKKLIDYIQDRIDDLDKEHKQNGIIQNPLSILTPTVSQFDSLKELLLTLGAEQKKEIIKILEDN